MSFLLEFARYLRTRRKYWLLPMLVTLGLVGGLLVAVEGSAIAPFMYTFF